MPKKKNEIQVYKKNEIDIKQTAWDSLSKNSQESYNFDYKLFFGFVKKDAREVTANDVLRFIEFLRGKGYKNATINRKIASLSKLFKVMIAAKEIQTNPVDELRQFKNISFKTDKEVRSALTMQDVQKTTQNPKPEDKIIVIVIRMLAKTGLRISEMINIKNKDIEKLNRSNYIIRIMGKGRKERFIYIENEFLKEIRKIFPALPGKDDYLFYNSLKHPLERKHLWRLIKEIFLRKTGKNAHPHLLRHVFITHKISVEKKDIKAVSRYCGHSKISTTLDMYVDKALDIDEAKVKI